MAFAWQLVPRYHPQMDLRDVLGALCRSGRPTIENCALSLGSTARSNP
jgi:hypothetical protein